MCCLLHVFRREPEKEGAFESAFEEKLDLHILEKESAPPW